MAHWAEIDENNLVVRVVVGDNNDPLGDEGYSWLIENLGGTWIQTSYNTYQGQHSQGGTPLRKNFAGIGFTYDPVRDAFITQKPEGYDSWIIDDETCNWVAPNPQPTDGGPYYWDEATTSWLVAPAEETKI
jgi:hypothetical protein